MPTTRIGSLTTPEGVARPLVAEDLRRLADQVSLAGIVMRFANATDRDAAFASLGISPSVGMICHLADVDRFRRWTGSAWAGLRPDPTTNVLSSSHGATTSETTFLTASFTVAAGDVIRVEVSGESVSNGADRQLTVRLKEDGVTIATRICGSPTNNLSTPFQAARRRFCPSQIAAGTHTYTVTSQMSTLTGNVQADAELSIELAN